MEQPIFVEVKVSVLQIDIDAGVRADCDLCPVARALYRAGGPGLRQWFFTTPLIGRRREHPVWQWIRKFDETYHGEPFEFILTIPSTTIEQPF